MTLDDPQSRAQSEQALPAPHLTEAELAVRWRVSLRTLQRWRRAGRTPAHLLLGRSPIFPWANVEAYEAAHCHSGGAE